jgi:hypothetical protein
VYAQLDQLIHPSQMVTYATRPPFSWTKAVIGGPLYMGRYGFLAFLLGLVLTAFTAGFAWPFLAFVSAALFEQRARSPA